MLLIYTGAGTKIANGYVHLLFIFEVDKEA